MNTNQIIFKLKTIDQAKQVYPQVNTKLQEAKNIIFA